jgi:rhodanese-related sulfurtransferase
VRARPQELAEIVKTKRANAEYVVVDVRDDDFRGGNIRGARNAPSRGFQGAVDALVADTRNVPVIVFHCMLSQERGPKAARVRGAARGGERGGWAADGMAWQVYAETRDALQKQGEDGAHEVYVLRGGFGEFQAKFKVRGADVRGRAAPAQSACRTTRSWWRIMTRRPGAKATFDASL